MTQPPSPRRRAFLTGMLATALTAALVLPVTGPTSATSPSAAAVVAEVGAVPLPPPQAPQITGTPRVGEHLQVVTDPWSPETTALSFQWLAEGVPLEGATTATLELTAEHLGARVSVTVSGTVDGGLPVTVTTGTTEPVAAGMFSAAPVPNISGSARVGAALTATTGAWLPSASYQFQWLRNGGAIAGADRATYVLTAADRGAALTVRVTATAPGYAATSRVSAATARIGAGTFAKAPVPTLSAAPRVGTTIRVRPGSWSPSAALSYQWKLDGRAIAGATNAWYTPRVTDRWHELTVTVTARRDGFATRAMTSAPRKVSNGVFTAAPPPRISGLPRVGARLTATAATWSPGATLSYQWQRSGVPVPGATRATYNLTAVDRGKKVTVTVTGRRAGYAATTRTSAPTQTVLARFARATAPTISGSVRVGAMLRATVRGWSPTPTAYTYQWKRNGTPIPGATRSTYRLAGADYGKTITVTVTGQRWSYLSAARTSAATVRVARPAAGLTNDGQFRVGTDVAAGTYVSADAPDGMCYWERRRYAGADFEGIIANGLTWGGQTIVTISASDRYFETDGCGSWTRMYKLSSPRTSVGDGQYAVGVHIAPGTYRAPGGGGCYWARLSGFGGSLNDIIDNSYSDGGTQYVTISSGDVGFETNDCGTFTRVSG